MTRTVLIIDDHDDIRAILRDVLEEEGYQVQVAGNGEEGLQALRRSPHPCVVVLDLVMPVMDGWQLLAAMHADDHLRAVPVIVLTAAISRNESMVVPGATAVFRKPVDPYDLLAAIEEAMPQLN
jgi:CheY-like chemotaxis protein